MTAGYDRTLIILSNYNPSLTEQHGKSLIRHLREELQEISIAINNLNNATSQAVDVEPDLPQTGMIRFVAAGATWDPDASGLGGFFGYDGTGWVLLGR
jgi:hypothetical protein